MDAVAGAIRRARPAIVQEVVAKEKKKNPVPPFITSKLQQEASRKLGFTVKKTMTLAQRLYEGMDLGERGTVGLITYMRTDSTRIAAEALDTKCATYIGRAYGKEYLPEKPRVYKAGKMAQEAHEAIRPTVSSSRPSSVEDVSSARTSSISTS